MKWHSNGLACIIQAAANGQTRRLKSSLSYNSANSDPGNMAAHPPPPISHLHPAVSHRWDLPHLEDVMKRASLVTKTLQFHFKVKSSCLLNRMVWNKTLQSSEATEEQNHCLPFFSSVMDSQFFTNPFFLLEALPVQFGLLKGAHFLFFGSNFPQKAAHATWSFYARKRKNEYKNSDLWINSVLFCGHRVPWIGVMLVPGYFLF